MENQDNLVENTGVRQRPDEGYRRWFVSRYFDLIVWYDQKGGAIKGFQLAMSKNFKEREFTWTTTFRSSHKVSDSHRGLTGGMQTAILFGDAGRVPEDDIARFRAESAPLEPAIRDLVLSQIARYNDDRKQSDG